MNTHSPALEEGAIPVPVIDLQEYDVTKSTGMITTQRKARTGSICLHIVEAVLEATDQSYSELPLLSDSINTDALNEVFNTDPHQEPLACVVFSYAECIVVLRSNGTVSAIPVNGDSSGLPSVPDFGFLLNQSEFTERSQ